jgi:fructose-bisphosphate aldolase class I
MDESNATCGLRLASIGLENTEVNRQAYRQLLCTTPGLGEYVSGAILFEETLYQSTTDGKLMVDCLKEQNIVPGIKVDKVCTFNIQPSFVLQHIGFVSSAGYLGLSLRIDGFCALLQGLVPLAGSNNESWCQGLDGLASRTAAYYKQGARFDKWYVACYSHCLMLTSIFSLVGMNDCVQQQSFIVEVVIGGVLEGYFLCVVSLNYYVPQKKVSFSTR